MAPGTLSLRTLVGPETERTSTSSPELVTAPVVRSNRSGMTEGAVPEPSVSSALQ
jgi:hypothetical protein